MPLSDAGAQAMLNGSFGDSRASTWPATLYVGLSTTNPATSVTEPSGNGYARVSVANTTAQWPTISGTTRQKTNATAIIFPPANPSSWGTITHYVIYNASSAGTLLAYGSLTSSLAVGSGETATINANALAISIT